MRLKPYYASAVDITIAVHEAVVVCWEPHINSLPPPHTTTTTTNQPVFWTPRWTTILPMCTLCM